jgi:hypothetical protein
LLPTYVTSSMRTLSTGPKLLAYVVAALGVMAALGRPWFGPSPQAHAPEAGLPTLEGPVNAFFGGIWRHLSEPAGTSAFEQFATADIAVLVLVALGIVGAGMALLPGAETAGRWLMRAAALAVLCVIVAKVVHLAGTNELVEARRGAVAGSLCAALMLFSALSVSRQKLRREPPRPLTSLHDPSLAHAGSFAPPGR